jgi:DNA gyrase subunit A
VEEYVEEKVVENYPVRLVFSEQGYFKKITMQSLIRGNEEQAFKEGDRELLSLDGENAQELLFFSDKGKCYKSRVADFEPRKSSVLGEYVAAKLGFEKDERCIYMVNVSGYAEATNVVFVFENGKAVKVPLNAYETKSARRKLTGAYSTVSPIVAVFREDAPTEITLFSSDRKAIQISSGLVPLKTTKTASGSTVFSLKKGAKVVYATEKTDLYAGSRSYKKVKIPATGVTVDGRFPTDDED